MHQSKEIVSVNQKTYMHQLYAVYKKSTLDIKIHEINSKRRRKIYHPNTSQKKAVVDILILDIADLKRRKVIIE